MAGKIFISYRRSETAWAARALFERLRREFNERVFIDIEGLSLGVDYTRVIDSHLDGCEVMLAVIGHEWLDEIQRRAAPAATEAAEDDDAEPDWVRAELSRALGRGIPVVPVLIEGAVLPAKKDLPAELKGLRNRHGLELHARFFDDQTGRLVREIAKVIAGPSPASTGGGPVAAAPQQAPPSPPAAPQRRAPWISQERSDSIGAWLEFEVNGVVQRLRWIVPGAFWMGSPSTEAGRSDDERRHRVTLSQGFWMADTACTQALWQAVMGDNPSYFTGDLQRPVEQVSWDDIQQKFLPALNRLLPGLDARLPTEAQWECACRAGTQTPFSFGERITTAQANYDGNYTYGGGAKGSYRKSTVPAKALPANGWGLHEMHGNVWEWCDDGYGKYAADQVVDPTGLANAASRVLRGGSWSGNPRDLRAAFRVHLRPDGRDGSIGFRVCRASPIGPRTAGAPDAGPLAR